MKTMKTILTWLIATAAGVTVASAQHLTILSHVGSPEHSSRTMDKTYNDSGMSGDSGSAGAANDTHSTDVFVDIGLLCCAAEPPVFIEYDLGQSFALTDLVIWNDNEPRWVKQGIKGATVEVREHGGPPTTVFTGDIPIAPADGTGPATASIAIDLTGQTARFIRITSDASPNHSWRFTIDGTANDFAVGISEVRVYGDPTGLGNTNTMQACCFIDPTCQDMEPADCTTAGGTPQGPGSECLSIVCLNPPEACCFGDGTCQDLEPLVCTGQDGTSQGASSTCATTACPQPEACCFNDGTCQDLLSTTCASQQELPQGIFTSCGTATCPQLEACCFADDTCQDMLTSLCTGAGGTPSGAETVCAPGFCVETTETIANNALEIGLSARDVDRYDLERATSLNPDWADLPSYIAGLNTNIVLVGDDDSDAQAFYRYSALLPPPGCGIAPAIGNPSISNNWDTTSAVSVRTANDKPFREMINAINGSGIDETGCFHTDNLFGPSPGSTTMGFNQSPDLGDRWAGGSTMRYWTEFSFDQAYGIFDILIWNYNEDPSPGDGEDPGHRWSMQGMKEVTIKYTSIGNGNGFGSDMEGDWTALGTFVFDLASGDQNIPFEKIPMDASAQYVIFLGADSAECNFMHDFGISSTSAEGGLSEVRFTLGEALAPPPLRTVVVESLAQADVTGLTFTSASNVTYELQRAAREQLNMGVENPAIWESTGSFTVGDGTGQTLYDPNGWDSGGFWYRVIRQ